MKKLEQILVEIEELEKLIEGKCDNGLQGAIVDKYIKCGKPGCKCSEGYRHGPYPHIQYYDEEGVLRTIYIRKKRKAEYEEKIAENAEFRKIVKQLVKLYTRKRQLESKNNKSNKGNKE